MQFNPGQNLFSANIRPTSDGGHIVAGNQEPPHVSASGIGVLIKFDNAANVQWSKTYTHSGNLTGFDAVNQTSDGGYIAAGFSQGDLFVLKVNSAGVTQWEKVLINSIIPESSINDIVQTQDGGYFAIAVSITQQQVLIKLDATGTLVWSKLIRGSSLGHISPEGIVESGDTILIAGMQQNPGTGYRASIVKVDESTGSVLGALFFRDTLHGASSTQGVYITKIYTSAGGYKLVINSNGSTGSINLGFDGTVQQCTVYNLPGTQDAAATLTVVG